MLLYSRVTIKASADKKSASIQLMTVNYANPQDAEAAFYRAFADRDMVGMQHVWADSPNAMCVHPGGSLLHGTTDILHSWNEILSNASLPEIRFEVVHSLLKDDISVHTVREAIRPANSDDTPTIVISTNVYQKTTTGWLIITHHASLPLVDQREPARSLH